MRVSLRWLKEMLGLDLSPAVIAEHLTLAGLEVEDGLDLGMESGKIVVAEVQAVAPHPDADKLRVCSVDAGTGEVLQIVCGAPNVEAGKKYPCALVGAVLPGDFKIKKSKIRGVESAGMLCSAKELSLGSDHGGIMELPAEWEVGKGFDYLCEVKITPNRPDCTSMLGIAREIAAREKKKVFPPQPRVREMLDPIERSLELFVPAKAECPRYACRLIRGVKVGPSPAWLRVALEASGMRSINNIVDVTNYVLLELGHPLHAFDMDKIEGAKINVRLAQPGEKMTVIDGTEIELTGEDLVIADETRPVALAGIMGGRDSEVGEATVDVLLESAYFSPGAVRKTARRFGMNTEASYRFERGTDRERLGVSLNRATQFIQELAGGEVAKGMLDAHAHGVERAPIPLEIARVNKVLGVKLASREVADCLVALEFEILRSDRDLLVVTVPSHRVDIHRAEDLIEEVARVYNYNAIPTTLPRIVPGEPVMDAAGALLDSGRAALAAKGFCEAIGYSFIGDKETALFGFDPARQPRLANPLTVDQALMRPSLAPGLLAAVAHNQKQKEETILLFEAGKVWGPAAAEAQSERLELCAVMAGTTPLHWTGGARGFDFFDMKAAAECVAAAWGGGIESAAIEDCAWLHPGRAARLVWRGGNPGNKKESISLGEVGELHPDLAAAFDLAGRVHLLRIDVAAAASITSSGAAKFASLPKFPGSHRDLALVVDRALPAASLIETAEQAGGAMLESAALFDVYEGEHVAADKKSVALRLRLRSAEKTLTEDEIQAATDKILKRLEKNCGAALRA